MRPGNDLSSCLGCLILLLSLFICGACGSAVVVAGKGMGWWG